MRNRTQVIFPITLLLFSSAIAQSNSSFTVDQKVSAIMPKVIEWRRHIHKNPELSNREFKTAEFVATHLRSLGIEVKTGVAKTGVVGLLKGGKPGPVIALRADMDALPVKERTGVPFQSTVTSNYLGQDVPVMHACGHDAHIAIMMATAEVLAGMKKDIQGTVKFIFQPAEEGAPGDEEGGAPLMIKEGVMDNPKVDAIFGLHIKSEIEAGKIKYKSGAFMASSDWFSVTVKGKQTHGADPWKGIDPIVISAQIINSLQTIVSRRTDLTRAPVVISVGKIHSGLRNNIIPEECEFGGTIRTLNSEMKNQVREQMTEVVKNIAEANGGSAEIKFITRTLVIYNDPALVKNSIPSLVEAAGKENVAEAEWGTVAEDFSYYGEKAPSFFFNIGGMPKGGDPAKAPPHHTPDFYIDDSRLDVGIKAFCDIVLDYVKTSKPK
jgi:amidohydrolase